MIKKEKKQHFIQTQADPRTLALLLTALFAGLQNYGMAWVQEDRIRTLWMDGIRILLKPSYAGTYGEEKND